MSAGDFTTYDLAVKAVARYSWGHSDWRAIHGSVGEIIKLWPESWYKQYEAALAEAQAARK